MKKLTILFAAPVLLVMNACSSTYHAGNATPDDVYYSSKDYPKNQAQATYPATPPAAPSDYSQPNATYDQNSSDQNNNQSYQDQNSGQQNGYSSEPQPSTTTTTQDPQGNTYITNNYYNDDDYYDYAYSARLRRYYTPAIGYSYYDPYYTNSYWYDYTPASWGVSIYLGYNWWAPSYYYSSPFCYGGGVSFGWGYNPWGYDPWYGGWHNPYSYGHGYNHGYADGYWDGYNHGYSDGYYGLGNPNPYYYNSYDATSYYYGPRGSASDNSPRPGNGPRRGGNAPVSLGEKYQIAQQEGRIPTLPAGGTNTPRDQVKPAGRPNTNGQDNLQNNPGRPSKNNTQQDVRPNSLDQNGNVRPATGGKDPVQQTRPGQINQDRNPVTTPSNPGAIKNPNGDTRPAQNTIPQTKDQQVSPKDNITQPTRPNTNPPKTSPVRPSDQQQNYPKNNINQNQNPRNNDWNSQPKNNEPSNPRDVQPAQSPSPKTEPSRNPEYQRPQQHQPRDQYNAPKQDRNYNATPSPRNETRTPVFQPRNEPKQFRQESPAPSQRSTTPSSPAPSKQNSGEQRNSGGKRR